MHSCEYASRVTASARLGRPPGWRGARRPENRVWARSKLPHQKWTGLVLPTNRLRNTSRTRLIWQRSCQHARAAAGSYERRIVSARKRMGVGTWTGLAQSRALSFSRATASLSRGEEAG